MFAYIFIAVLLVAWAWFAYEINRAPLMEDEDNQPPRSTEWHDDDYYPDAKP